ncbi:MAG TPA: hypothetical protein VF528_13925 [Pyrinomonadaceae bacterium]|jgi:hypothetical protein
MKDNEIRKAQSLGRLNDFGLARKADFSATSLGGQKFAEAAALVAEVVALGEEQMSADAAVRASATARRVARLSVLQQMRAIRDTAKAMEAEIPGVSDKFRVPTKNGSEALINAARAFVTTATPLKAEFVQREMPDTFLEDLTAAINEFESANNSFNLSMGRRVGATAGLKNAFVRSTRLKRELNPMVLNKYRDDPASLAEWKSAIHVEAAPKQKVKKEQPSSPAK